MERLPQSTKQEREREEKRKEKGSRLHHDSAEMSPLVLSPLLELARSSFGRRFLSRVDGLRNRIQRRLWLCMKNSRVGAKNRDLHERRGGRGGCIVTCVSADVVII